MTKDVPSALGATLAIAAVTLRRIVRGRALWVGLVIAVLPLVFAAAFKGRDEAPDPHDLFVFTMLILAVLAPMFIATSIGEEIEDRTMTYLWSRPVPRWSVPVGKLVALAPLVDVIVTASWTLSSTISWDHPPSARSCLALTAGTLAMSALAMGMATVSPRHGMAFTILYALFFDIPVGMLPATLREISMTFQMRSLSGLFPEEPATASGAIVLATIAVVWSIVAAARIRRLEA